MFYFMFYNIILRKCPTCFTLCFITLYLESVQHVLYSPIDKINIFIKDCHLLVFVHGCEIHDFFIIILEQTVEKQWNVISKIVKKLHEVTSKNYRRLHPKATWGYIQNLQEVTSKIYMRLHPKATWGYIQKLQEVTSKSYMRLHPKATWGYIQKLHEVTTKIYRRFKTFRSNFSI